MKHIIKQFLFFFCLICTITSLIFWRVQTKMSSYPGGSLHAASVQVLHGLMLAVVTMLVMWLASNSTKISAKCKFKYIIQSWLVTIITGVTVTILLAFRHHFAITNFYQTLFPLLRNTYPLFSGICLGLFISIYSEQLKPQHQHILNTILWASLIIPFIFGVNVFHWNSGTNPLLFANLFLLANNPSSKPAKDLWRSFAVTTIIGCGLLAIMPAISTSVHYNMSTAARFTTMANPLIIYAGWSLIQLIQRKKLRIHFHNSFNLLAAGLALSTNPEMIIELKADLQHYANSSFKLLAFTILASILLVLVAYIWLRILQLLDGHILSNKINRFVADFDPNDLNHWLKEKWNNVSQQLKQQWPVELAFILAYLLSCFSLLMMNHSWRITPNVGASHNIFLYTFSNCQPMILFNTIILFSFTMFLWAISRHYFLSIILSNGLMIIWVIANRMKIAARDEPVMPSELKMVSVWGSLIKMTGPIVIISVMIAVILAIILIIFLEKHYHQPAPRKWSSIIALLCLPLIILSSFRWNHQASAFRTLLAGSGDDPMFYNQLSGAKVNGPLVQFLNNLDVTVMEKPRGYSKISMLQIKKRYEADAQNINQDRHSQLNKQTIIFNLSESLSDPRRVPGVHMKNNPLTKIDQIKHHTTSGLMISSGYGGGTANMEYMTLTGFALANFSPTLPTPYTQLVDNLKANPSIVGSFTNSTAIHPYLGTFYNRETVYKKFGFQHFYYLGGPNRIRHRHRIDRSPYLSDQTAYANVIDQLHRQSHGQFIQLVTMQNHFPYNQNFYNDHQHFKASAVKNTDINALEDYSVGIHHTDNAVQDFIKQIDQIKRPITIVFYGDHLPGSIYGNNLQKDGLKLHETDYFVYSNRYAQEHGAQKKLRKDVRFVDPNDFIALAAEQTNSKVNWYQAMLTDIMHQLPAFALNTQQAATNSFNTNAQFINQQGSVASQKRFTKRQKQLWHDYKLVQYDITAGHHYLVHDGQLK